MKNDLLAQIENAYLDCARHSLAHPEHMVISCRYHSYSLFSSGQNGKILTLDGTELSPEASLHRLIYNNLSHVNGILHLTSGYAARFADAQRPIRMYLDTGAKVFGESVTIAYNTNEILRTLCSSPAVLCPHNGAFVVSESLAKAVETAVYLEYTARVFEATEYLNGIH